MNEDALSEIPTQFPKNKHINKKKGERLFMANHFHKHSGIQTERVSSFISKGSITLEAALVVPIFFFAILGLSFVLEMMAIQTTIHHALHNVGKELAQEAYTSLSVSANEVEQRVRKCIGVERMESSMIRGGANGLDCSGSRVDVFSTILELSTCYELEIPVLMFDIPIVSCEDKVRVKGWTGYATGTLTEGAQEIVYVTDYGLVYHRDASCTYLDMSVRAVGEESIESLRNQSGGKYYPCSACSKDLSVSPTWYVTDYGDRYHSSLDCKKIKRNIYAIPLNEAYGLGGCSKCVK